MKPLAITMGDPAGIGPEIIASAFMLAPELTAGCVVAGDLASMRRGAAAVAGARPPLATAVIESVQEAAQVPPRCIPLLQVGAGAATPPPWGEVSERAGRLAAEAVLWGARAATSPRACLTRATRSCCRPRRRRTPASRSSACRCA